jgi:hypothetical protein
MPAPADHYWAGVEAIERVDPVMGPQPAYLEAIAHFLAGILRCQMSSTAN